MVVVDQLFTGEWVKRNFNHAYNGFQQLIATKLSILPLMHSVIRTWTTLHLIDCLAPSGSKSKQ